MSYTIYKIMKKPGHYDTLPNGHRIYVPAKYRVITAPNDKLKTEQRRILKEVLSSIPISNRAFGFSPNKDIKDNAAEHIKGEWILEMDMKDFFDTITEKQVCDALLRNGIENEMAEYIARICTWNGTTPQGAPTSPTLSNIVCKPMDKKIKQLAAKYNCIYSRYADDITISTMDKENGYAILQSLKGPLESIIQRSGFKINKSKTQVIGRHRKQSVTGVVVNTNEQLYPSKTMRKEVDSLTYKALRDAKLGLIKTYKDLESTYESYPKIHGKVSFLCQVNPAQNKKYMDRLIELRTLLK